MYPPRKARVSAVNVIGRLLILSNCKCLFLPANGPELSCGDDSRRSGGIQSARGMSSPIVTGCFARAKSSTAVSVSLSDWLGRSGCK